MSKTQKKPKICLNMIVKDEAHIICETLESVEKYIDYWVICDTGSEDGTQEIIKKYFKNVNIPGILVEEEWKNFGYNRTIALKSALKYSRQFNIDYVWIIDADDLVVGNIDLKEHLKNGKDGYYLKYGEGFTYDRMQLFISREDWEYIGVLHEYPQCTSKENTINERITGEYYIDSRRLGNRNKDPNKYLKDALTLEKGLEEEPDNVRYMFYLGQSYMDHGDFTKSIYWYEKRIVKGGWYEEVYYSYYRIAVAKQRRGDEWSDVEKAYLDAWNYCKTRAEPLYEIAKYYQETDNFQLGYKYALKASKITFPIKDKLFIFKDVYDWKIHDVLSICAYYVGKYQEAFDAGKIILSSRSLPEYQTNRIKDNMNFCVPHLYPDKDISKVNQNDILVFYVGYALFNKEALYGSELALLSLAKELAEVYDIYIFGYSCEDMNKDNKYEKITFMNVAQYRIFQEKYHINILIISRYINYFIDFDITADRNYIWIHDAVCHPSYNGQYLTENGKFIVRNVIDKIDGIITLTEWHKQVIINKYNFPLDKVFIIGNGINDIYFNKHDKIKHRFIYTSDPSRGLDILINYFHDVHKEFPESELYVYRGEESFNNDKCRELIDIMNNCNYIHYKGKVTQEQLAIEFLKTDIWLYPTWFSETYCMSGLEAMRGGCYCIASDLAALHDTISDRGVLIKGDISTDKIKCEFLNAVRKALTDDDHKLNIQTKAIEWSKNQTWKHRSDSWMSIMNKYELNKNINIGCISHNITNNFFDKIYCINLEKSTERWDNSVIEFKRVGLNVDRFNAINGSKLSIEELIRDNIISEQYIEKNNMRSLGCMMSHITIWKEIVKNNYKWTFILEDDVLFLPNFEDLFPSYLSEIPEDCDLILVGSTSPNSGYLTEEEGFLKYGNIVNDKIMKVTKYLNGAFSYGITLDGAKKLVNNYLPLIKPVDFFDGGLFNIYAFRRPKTYPENFYFNDSEIDDTELSFQGLISIRGEPSTININKIIINDEWIYVPYIDSYGNDIEYHANSSVVELKRLALKNDKCIGFNSLGYLKDKLLAGIEWRSFSTRSRNMSTYIHIQRYKDLLTMIGLNYDREISVLKKLIGKNNNESSINHYNPLGVLLRDMRKGDLDIINAPKLPIEEIHNLNIPLDGYGFKNGSIIQHNDGWIFTGDKTNVITDKNGSRTIIGEDKEFTSFIVVTDNNYNPLVVHELLSNKDNFKYEDPRVFSLKDEIWVMMNCDDGINVNMVTGKLNLDTYKVDNLYRFSGDFPSEKWQKNWSPYNGIDEFNIVYSINPWKLYNVDISNQNNIEFPIKMMQYNEEDNDCFIMGGTPYIRWEDGWLSVAHEQTWGVNTKCRYYAHRFIYKISEKVLISDLFYITTRTMEYATGIHKIDDEHILISLGIEDRKTIIVKINMKIIDFSPIN